MSEQVFRDYMKENSYTDVKIKRYKIRDHVHYRCPPTLSNPDGVRVQVILRKGLHIDNVSPKIYPHIAMSKDERAYWRFRSFLQLIEEKEVV